MQTMGTAIAIKAEQTYWITLGVDTSNDMAPFSVHRIKLFLNLYYLGLKPNYKEHNKKLSATPASFCLTRGAMFCFSSKRSKLSKEFPQYMRECSHDCVLLNQETSKLKL